MIGLALAMMLSGAAAHGHAGETVDCHFPRTGHVVINTREPGGSITVNGRSFPSASGSGHYYTTDPSSTYQFMFKPGMTLWATRDTMEPFTRCSRKKNAV